MFSSFAERYMKVTLMKIYHLASCLSLVSRYIANYFKVIFNRLKNFTAIE